MDVGTVTAAPTIEITDDDWNDDVLVLATTIGRGTTIQNAISVDDHYSDDKINIQRAIFASLSGDNKFIIDLSGSVDGDDDVQILNWPPFTPKKHRNRRNASSSTCGISIRETGESSNSQNLIRESDNRNRKRKTTFMCEICVEPKPCTESFSINGCTHSYCTDCMIKYVASKLQDNVTQIRCPVPDCKGILEPDQCRSILPDEVFNRWGTALCEAVILASEKFYCPFKDCSALLIDDKEETITQSECPDCRRLFCAQCKVAWHSGIECGEYQKLNKDEREREDIMLMNLAKNKNWRRCSKCRFYVERSAGCLFMRCRCGYTFCYNCGAHLKDHYCRNCKH